MAAHPISPGSRAPAELNGPGVLHVSYDERHCPDAASSLRQIRAHLAAGWWLTQVWGTSPGPFTLIFRQDEQD